MGQFFHDQLAAFLHDHFEDSSSVPILDDPISVNRFRVPKLKPFFANRASGGGQKLRIAPGLRRFRRKGAHFHGKWGLGAPSPPTSEFPVDTPGPPPLSWIFSKTPTAPQEKGGGGEGSGGWWRGPFYRENEPPFRWKRLVCGNSRESLARYENSQGTRKGTNLRGQTEPKRRFSLIVADFCRFSPFPRKQSIWETQIFAENRWFSQETAENRRNPQKTADWRLSP